jgi:hypothetical protein
MNPFLGLGLQQPWTAPLKGMEQKKNVYWGTISRNYSCMMQRLGLAKWSISSMQSAMVGNYKQGAR